MSPRWLHWPAAVGGVLDLVSFTATASTTTGCTTITSYTAWLGRYGNSTACVQQQTAGFLFYLWADASATPSDTNTVVESFFTNWSLYDSTTSTNYAATAYTTAAGVILSDNRIGFNVTGLNLSSIAGNTLILRAEVA